jgi:hypothetical protein
VTYALLQNVVVLKVDAGWKDYDCLRSLNIETAVWSPTGLQTGIILSMSWSLFYSGEFELHVQCTLAPKLQR